MLEVYAGLSDEARLYALGLLPNVTLLEKDPVILDTEAATRAKTEKAPYSVRPEARAALPLWISPLAAFLARRKPPRGLEAVLRGLSRDQLAFMALRSLLDRIHRGWSDDRHKERPKAKNPKMLFRLELGRRVRDEIEFGGLLAAKRWVKAGTTGADRQIRLGKFRRLDWTNAECAQVGDWLWDALAEMTCWDEDEHGFPGIDADHKAALEEFAKDHFYDHPLYRPKLEEPPKWTDWYVDCPGDIGGTFVKADDAKTQDAIKAAFADGSIRPHAEAVSAIQSVAIKINAAMLPLVREFAGDEYRRDVAIAEELVKHPRFWNRVRCDRRGRLIQLCDLNYTRGDPVRSLFMFADGKPIGTAIEWLEVAVANAYGAKGTTAERRKWLAGERELIKAVAVDPGLIWRWPIKAKEPFQFAAACIEYIAADTHGSEYITHLPVWLDASSNGLQHLACMRRDVALAKMVNLEARSTERALDEVRDVYEILARHERQTLRADDDTFWCDLPLSLLRDLVKRPVMTLPYGVTKQGMLDQIKEECPTQLNAPFKANVRLRDHVWKAIEEKLPGAMETREYIQDLARRCLEHGKFMEWTTLSGFPIVNRYTKSKIRRVRLPFSGQSVTIAGGYTDKPLKQKTINSIVANVVHSSDAAHLALSVLWAMDEGITNIMTIHDCFGTVAPDVRRFGQIRRWELAKMYLSHNTLARLRDNLPPGTNDLLLPDFDPDFDRLALGESEYFDR
jgi:DNA-directed RNA polymerase